MSLRAFHNLGEARRVTDLVARVAVRDTVGQVAECGPCADILGNRGSDEIDDYFEARDRSNDQDSIDDQAGRVSMR